MVAEAGVGVVEEAGGDHEDFALEVLLGGGAVEADCGLLSALFEGVADGDGGAHGGGSVYVVAAAVAHAAGDEGVLAGDGLVTYAGEGVILAHEADDGLAAPPLGGDGGGHPRDAEPHPEAVPLKGGGDEPAALLLKEPVLGEAPDLVADLGQLVLVILDPLPRSFLRHEEPDFILRVKGYAPSEYEH